ncbi:glycine--tRNA ligase subunit alpha [Alphaproteobacteria bacterium]
MYFQDIILALQHFWIKQGCILLQPYDMEIGAGTSHPATGLRCLDANPWKVVYVQSCRRPSDGRYGDNPNRVQHYYQMQVILKPSPINIQELCLQSLKTVGIDSFNHDLRFVEDDWANPTLGAWGLGYEIWCNGMEIAQFTYMQQLGGIECKPVPVEITYGLERLALYIQNVNKVWDIKWDDNTTYYDIFGATEKEYCYYNFEYANTETLGRHFRDYLDEAEALLGCGVAQPAYDYCLKASHAFNVLEARGVLSVAERAAYIAAVRKTMRECCQLWVELRRQDKL